MKTKSLNLYKYKLQSLNKTKRDKDKKEDWKNEKWINKISKEQLYLQFSTSDSAALHQHTENF